MANSYDLLIKIGGSLSGSYLSTIGKVQKSLGGIEKATKPATSLLGSLGGKLLGIAGGVAAGVTLDAVAEETSASEKAMAQMQSALKSTGGAAGETQAQLVKLAQAQSKMTTYSQNTTEQAENMLLTFTNIKSNVFPQTLQLTEDMATAMHTDATSAALTLGKALNDPANGLSKLTRQGVTFTDAQKKQIAAMEKAGNVAGAQKIMLAELSREFGGSAKAAGDTLDGEISKAKNSLLESASTGFKAILPIVTSVLPLLVGGVQKISGLIEEHQGDIQNVVKSIIHIGQIAGNAILPAVEDIFKAVAPFAAQIFPALESGIQSIGKTFGNVVSAFKEGWSNGFTQMQTPLETLAAFAGNAVYGILGAAKNLFSFVQSHGPQIQGVIHSVFGALGNALTFIVTHRTLVEAALVGIGAALAAIKIAGIVTSVMKGFQTITAGIKGLQGAAKAAKIFQNLFGMSPQVLLVLAIVAAIAALAFIVIKNWKPISKFFIGMWAGIVGTFNAAKAHIIGFFTEIWNFLKKWGALILLPFAPFIAIPLLIIQHFGQIKTFFAGLWPEIVSGFKGFINMMIDGLNMLIGGLDKFSIKMPGWFPGIGGKSLGFSIPQIPRLAQGGIVAHRPGGILANIGEGKYDEAVVPLRGGALGGGSVTFVYAPHNEFKGGDTPAGVQKVLDDDKAKFEKQMRKWMNEHKRRSPGGKVEFA